MDLFRNTSYDELELACRASKFEKSSQFANELSNCVTVGSGSFAYGILGAYVLPTFPIDSIKNIKHISNENAIMSLNMVREVGALGGYVATIALNATSYFTSPQAPMVNAFLYTNGVSAGLHALRHAKHLFVNK